MKRKTFKTLEEQIKILESKGLVIKDYNQAKEILFRENYFFVNGYRRLLMKQGDKIFAVGATLDELYAIFIFDRKLRNILFKTILIVENNIKSIMSYQLSKKYGYKEKDYLNPKNFRGENFKLAQVNDVLAKMKRQIRLNSKQHRATMHYIANYGYIPMWVSVKVLSFGIMAELYTILKLEDRKEIADYYKVDATNLDIFLSILSNYRNLCAHEDILYDHRTQRSILDNECHDWLNIPQVDGEYIYGKRDLFAVIIIMKYLLNDDEFVDLVNEINYEISRLDGKIKSVDTNDILKGIGFPENWLNIRNL